MKLKTIIFYQKIQAILLFVLACNFIFSQTPVSYTAGPTNAQINTALQGSNITISGGTLNLGNKSRQIATFTGGIAAGLSMANGVYFGTGNVANELTTNNTVNSTVDNGSSVADSDLSSIDNTCNIDVVSYSFTIMMGPKMTMLNIAYQFGSEEYPDFVGSPYDDAFGFFVSGPGITGTQNLAKLPNGNPTAINKVNIGTPGHYTSVFPPVNAAYDGTQSALYINNGHATQLDSNGNIIENTASAPKTSPVVAVQFNGLTRLINYSIGGLTPGGTYTFKIAIGDNTDPTYDSGVFIDQIYGTATVVANNDSESLIAGTTGTVNVLTNDSYNSTSPVTLTDVTLSQVSTTNTGVNINTSTGLVTVAAGTAPGVYTIVYQICDNTFSSNCKTATMTVTVLADSDGDGITDNIDIDDDNDGILDTEENAACASMVFPVAQSDAKTWTNGNYSIYTIGGNTNGLGYQESGWQKAAYSNNSNNSSFFIEAPIVLNSTSGTFSRGTFTFTDVSNNTGPTIIQNDNTDGFNSGTTTKAISVVPTNTSPATYEWKLDINFNNNSNIKYFNFDFVDIFDSSPVGNGNLDYTVYIDNQKVWRSSGTNVGSGLTGTKNIEDGNGNNQGSQTVGQNIENSIGVISTVAIGKITIIAKSTLLPPNVNVSADLIGIDNFVFATSCDTDGDGIPNYLDLDSDNDGCPDAIEGGADIKTSQLVNSAGTLQGGNGVNPVITPTSGTYNQAVLQNLCATGSCVNAQGLPQFTPTVPTNYSNTTGQTSGTAYNNTIGNNACKCYKPAATGGTILPTNHGISTLGRAGDDGDGDTTNDWPMVRKGAWTVLESKTKGFVINRVTLTADLANITPAVEGMMVYDEEADCLKIYTKDDAPATSYSWRCFNNQTCPDVL